MKLQRFKTVVKRRQALEKDLGLKLSKISKALVESESKIHCENLIGATILPLGVAGPLRFASVYTDRVREVYIPLATTEGALVASVNRGCKALSLSDSVNILVEKVGISRAPVFYIENISKGKYFENWLEKNFDKLSDVVRSTSSHLRLLRYEFFLYPPYAYVRFFFDPDQAMGMNMATIAVKAISEYVLKKLKIDCLALSGNLCVDKKPSFLNFVTGRGFKVWAEVLLPDKVLNNILKTDASRFLSVFYSKNLYGSLISGSISANAHFANIVSAFYSAVGQDLAHTVEGSLGTVFAEKRKESLYFCVHLPAVLLGVVGGGTKLDIKQEAISITNSGNSIELAEVLGGAVLAGELSLLSSLAEGSLAGAHKKLGR
ncbi:MAG: 3-hydroxy-3-methylglutaryl-CoA reductase [Patescibacteria group bacterium]|nr:MAG: 3-hydroxy-3-methylglutaryl-CoA reductase [Patescibacteria group bacterium]